MTSLKLLVLIISDDSNETYRRNRDVWRKYIHIHKSIDSYFITLNDIPGKNYPYIENDTLYFNGKESFENIIYKTIKALEFFNKKGYDYVIRTNLSSLWNYFELYKFIQTLPSSGVYCGVVGCHNNQPFVSGAGIIISKDVVETIIQVQNEIYNVKIIDDVALGTVLLKSNIVITPANRVDFRSISEYDKSRLRGAYHFRLKCHNRCDEAKLMNMVYSDVYGGMKITHVVASVNDNPKYTRFIPLFLKSWTTFYPDIKPLIIYVGDSPLNEFVDSVVRVFVDKTISTVFASQIARCLYPSLLDPESIVLISDIDMLPANSTYFTSNMSRLRYDNFVSYRPLSVVGNGQIAMCYVMATAKTWKDTFKINDINDINTFLQTYSHVNFDGMHGGNGWFTDQQILYDHLINKGQKHAVEFLSDEETGYNRLDWYSHNYDKDTFISMLKSGRYSDAHIYAHACPWTVDDILYITSLM